MANFDSLIDLVYLFLRFVVLVEENQVHLPNRVIDRLNIQIQIIKKTKKSFLLRPPIIGNVKVPLRCHENI